MITAPHSNAAIAASLPHTPTSHTLGKAWDDTTLKVSSRRRWEEDDDGSQYPVLRGDKTRKSKRERFTMRVPIRVQLALLVLLTSMLALAVISISTWVNNYNFVVNIKSQGLALTASLKAAQISSDLELLESTCSTIVTRILIQSALLRFYSGNNTVSNWVRAKDDIQSALASGGYSQLLQVRVYSKNATGSPNGLVNVTSDTATDVVLPYTYENGTEVKLGDSKWDGSQDISTGMPSALYPNITYTPDGPTAFDGDFKFGLDSTLLLGPIQINSSFAMVSITLPIINNTSATDILGYMTVIAEASALYNIQRSREGLDDTGIVMLMRPTILGNRFPAASRPSDETYTTTRETMADTDVRFVFPPAAIKGQKDRHGNHNASTYQNPFPLKNYPAALWAYADRNNKINNASSELDTKNEEGIDVAVGWARPRTRLADWVLIVEQTKKEAFAPVVELRKILLACVFGTTGLILLLVIPMAHWSVLPIARLKEATEKSVQPPGYSPTGSIMSHDYDHDDGEPSGDEENAGQPSSNRSNPKTPMGFIVRMKRLAKGKRKRSRAEHEEDARRRVFKIPGKVIDRKHWITDELTELTGTFNEMSDELMMQYVRLEERVAERTRELEISKKAAEAANESKTLFIANISHELKTPLNGILGMCAVCMGEDDLPRIKRSLQVVYKSGDLLLHLLNDLLTFSKNQIGQTVAIEQKEFGLSDIRSQIVTIFDKQVKEGNISFNVRFIGTEEDVLDDEMQYEDKARLPAIGPNGTGRMKDMRLWGDQHRILQVLINLVSNSLKFTPEGGKVEVRIKCLGQEDTDSSNGGSRKSSTGSKTASGHRSSRQRHRMGSGSDRSTNSHNNSRLPSSSNKQAIGTALLINPMDPKAAKHHVQVRERSPTPPPSNAKTLLFEFEVEDTGPGIPASFQERVFEPFVQADLGLSRKYGGTGLGLSICSQLATLMGGTIGLESTEGVGTTFKMRIPLKFLRERASSTASSSNYGSNRGSQRGSRTSSVTSDVRSHPSRSLDLGKTGSHHSGHNQGPIVAATSSVDVQPRLVGLSQPFFASVQTTTTEQDAEQQMKALDRVAKAKAKEVQEGGKIRVLVAEDNLVNQEVVLRMLKLEDIYDVTVARDGQEAYEMVKSSMEAGLVYNLIFMDIQMPNLDGLQSTRLIRQMGYSAPIVALTAFAEESNVRECMESGMDMFLSKPIRRPALKQVLKKFATIPEEEESAEAEAKKEKEKKEEEKEEERAARKEKRESRSERDMSALSQQLKERRGAANTQSESSAQGERGRKSEEHNPMFPKSRDVIDLKRKSKEMTRDDSISPMSHPNKSLISPIDKAMTNGERDRDSLRSERQSENIPTPPGGEEKRIS